MRESDMDVPGRWRRQPPRQRVVMVHVPIPSGMGKRSAGHVATHMSGVDGGRDDGLG
jgi:hypothetical protein